MRLTSAIELYAGGKGSGPSKPCPECGPKGGKKSGDLVSRSGLSKAELDIHPRTIRQVNKVLDKLGVKERLAYGARDAEVYWTGGNADSFYSSGVGVARPSHLTVGGYLHDLQYKLENDQNVGTNYQENLRKRYKI